MKYKSINHDFIVEFPEFKRSYDFFFIDNNIAENEFQYMFYEGMIVHILDILLNMNESDLRKELIERFFCFIEKMVLSDDNDVINLAHIAFFEYRIHEWFKKSYPFMSELLVINIKKNLPKWGIYFDQNHTPNEKIIYSDVYGIRDNLKSIFKKAGYEEEIPYRYF